MIYVYHLSDRTLQNMFNNNKNNMFSSCANDGFQDHNGNGVANDSGPEVGAIYDGIQAIAQQSGVDHRFILAVIMYEVLSSIYSKPTWRTNNEFYRQESGGCVRVPSTANGYSNPGLMQSFQGYYTCK